MLSAEVDTHVLRTGRITGLLGALPAGGNTTGGWITAQVVAAPARGADGVLVTAEDDVPAQAVGGVGLGAAVRDIAGVVGADEGRGGGDDDG